MSRKDYVMIAAALMRARSLVPDTGDYRVHELLGVTQAATCLANELARANAAFDRVRFLKACGVQS